jgi:hypothetical protein
MGANTYRDTASRYSYLYVNAYGHTAAAHGVANDDGNQYTHRAVIDPDADATSCRHLHAHCLAGRAGRGGGGTETG